MRGIYTGIRADNKNPGAKSTYRRSRTNTRFCYWPQAISEARRYASRCTVSMEKAGRHTAMYSAPSGSGVL